MALEEKPHFSPTQVVPPTLAREQEARFLATCKVVESRACRDNCSPQSHVLPKPNSCCLKLTHPWNSRCHHVPPEKHVHQRDKAVCHSKAIVYLGHLTLSFQCIQKSHGDWSMFLAHCSQMIGRVYCPDTIKLVHKAEIQIHSNRITCNRLTHLSSVVLRAGQGYQII